jgi:hypothetical protein
MVEPKCKNCLLYNREKGECKVAVLIDGEEHHLPVFPEDHCHMDELGIEVQQVRWYIADPKTGKPADKGEIKIEYPEGFFGKEKRKRKR